MDRSKIAKKLDDRELVELKIELREQSSFWQKKIGKFKHTSICQIHLDCLKDVIAGINQDLGIGASF